MSLSPNGMPVAGDARVCGDLVQRIDTALERAADMLVAQQSPDGGWRSPNYGAMRDGLALTGPALKVLMLAGAPGDAAPRLTIDDAIAKGIARLRDAAPDPANPPTLDFPVYTAALAAITLHRATDAPSRDACARWLAFLRAHQLAEPLGWTLEDLDFGGWGYSIAPPRRPDDGRADRLPVAADLSSTLAAIGALRICGAGADDPAIVAARRFVANCRNPDGGFFFAPTHPVQNKAGEDGVDASGQPRFRSYGSATADGLRALLRTGADTDDPRVRAAWRWLDERFSTMTNPGDFAPNRAAEQDAGFFYHAWSIGHAMRTLDELAPDLRGRIVEHAAELASALVERQRTDGSWSNPNPFMREDDPIVATTLAAGALGACREILSPRSTPIRKPGATASGGASEP